MRGLALVERKRELRRLIRAGRNWNLLYADHIQGHGTELHLEICQRDLEGIVAKHNRATYGVVGPAGWFKVLNPPYSQKRRRREMFDDFRERQKLALRLRRAYSDAKNLQHG